MKKTMFFLFFLSLFLSVFSIALYALFASGVFLTLAITFCTTFYHFSFRLLIAPLLNQNYNKFMSTFYDYQNFWFREKNFEKKLYKILQVKKWKSKMPTWSPQTFDLQKNSVQQIVSATCQAEFIHELNALLSFVPLLGAIPFGEFAVFFITSLASAAFEVMFVLVQRYNRPRLVVLLLTNPLQRETLSCQ